jgi:hypothetical protein
MTDFIEVKHEGVAGTARVPKTALKHMPGWEPVEAPASELKGDALDAALRDAGLPLSGTADEKRARLAEHQGTTDTSEEN